MCMTNRDFEHPAGRGCFESIFIIVNITLFSFYRIWAGSGINKARCAICIKRCRNCGRHILYTAGLIEQSWLLWCRKRTADTKKNVSHARYRGMGHELIICMLIHWPELMTKGRWQDVLTGKSKAVTGLHKIWYIYYAEVHSDKSGF